MTARPALHSLLTTALSLTALLYCVSASAQQQQRSNALSEEEQVTAVDVVVELSKDGTAAVAPPTGLGPEDFSVEEGGRTLTVVGVETPPASEPWHFVIYFDHELSDPASIRWAASELADRALTLTELGEVEVVIADPEPRLLLGPTRSAVLLDQMLSGIFLEDPRGHEILALREEFLLAREEDESLGETLVVNALANEEVRLGTLRQDALLSTLIDRLPTSSRRAVLLVSDGFDESPETFYAEYAALDEQVTGALEALTEEWVETVAAYGWTVISIQAPEAVKEQTSGLAPAENSQAISFKMPGVVARLEGTLDPEKAAALHELGQQLAEQGKLDEAEETLEDALDFYHQHKAYARQRAAVLIDLGDVLLGQERQDEARLAIRQAVALDEDLAAAHPFVHARLDAPAEPLDTLAAMSGGRSVVSSEEMTAALAGLARRLRLTFQFQGAPDGENHRVAITSLTRDLQVRGPSWVRFGTPPAITSLRVRRLLSGEVENGGLVAKCRFVESSRTYSARAGILEIELRDPDAESAMSGELRLTVGLAPEDGPFEILRRTATFENGAFTLPLEIADNDVWLAVVVDDPVSDRWGGATAELE